MRLSSITKQWHLFCNGISSKTGQGLHDGKVPSNEEQLWIHIFRENPAERTDKPSRNPLFLHPQLQLRLILDEEHHECGKLARTRQKHPATVSTAKEGIESVFVAHNAVAGLSLKANSYHLLIYSLPFKMKYLWGSRKELIGSGQLDPLSELHFVER